jgi:hypothetical protein
MKGKSFFESCLFSELFWKGEALGTVNRATRCRISSAREPGTSVFSDRAVLVSVLRAYMSFRFDLPAQSN